LLFIIDDSEFKCEHIGKLSSPWIFSIA